MTRLFERSLEEPATLEALRVRHGLLDRLSRIQRSISHGAPLEEVFSAIAAGAAELLGDPVAGLRLIDEDDPTAMVLVASTGLAPEQLAQVRRGAVGEGAGGRAIVENAVVVVEDYPATSDGIARFGEFGVQNALAAPVRVDGRVVGSLTVASFEAGRRYDTVEQEVLAALAEHAGLALQDASLIDQRERTVEARFQALVRHASDLIAIVDEQGAVTFATESVGRALGIPVDRLIGTTLLAHVHPADRPRAATLLHEAAGAPGTQAPVDWRLIPPGGHFQPPRWMHVEVLATNLLEHPAVGGIVLNARDVTERVVAEQRRRDQDALYRQIVDTTHDGVWMTDPDDRTIFVNGALAAMVGRPPEEIVRRRPTEFMDPDAAHVVLAAMARRRRGVSERYEATLRRADGTALQLSISATPMFEDDRFVGSLALCGDITALAEARDQNERLEARLRHAQELELLGRLAGHVAHDFNQVLAVILGYAELLQRNAADERLREDLGRISEAAEHGAALSRQLVTFSRRDEGAPETLDLAETAASIARLVQTTAPRGVSVAVRAAEPLPVSIDPTKLRQVVMNLVDNGFAAMEDEGGELCVSTHAEGDAAVLTVSDTGAGMPPDVVARAVEPGFTTKPPGSGSGLGLAIVHGIVQGAGGRITLHSEPGRGTTVQVRLPREAAGPDEVPATAPATILLVDDDATVLELTRRVLAEQGYAVVAVPDAERALRAAREREIDLVLADQTLAGATGLELTRLVRELRPGTPAVIMSGYVAEVAASLPDGVAWRQKPFGAGALLASVRSALATSSS